MKTLENLSIGQLRQAIKIRERIEAMERKLALVLGGKIGMPHSGKEKRKMSAAARARIGAAQKARWAKLKGKETAVKPKRTMSAEARARMAAAAKERWKKAKAAGKKHL